MAAGARSSACSHDARARRRHVEAVGLAALDDLGVAGRDCTPAARAAAAIERAMRSRSAVGKPSSRMKPAERASGVAPAIAEVVDRAVDGQLADVAAGEEERRYDEGVGGERQPRLPVEDRAASSERLEQRVAELAQEERLDQVVGRLPAGAVGQRDPFVEELAAGPAPARSIASSTSCSRWTVRPPRGLAALVGVNRP